MRGLWPFARRSLLGRRGRTALLVSAVALAASLVVAVTSGMRTAQASLEDSIARAMGATDARIVHRYAEPFDASLLDEARKWSGVERAAGRLGGSITLANEASLGFQLGAKAVESVFIITDDAMPRLLFTQRFNIGVDAKAVAGPRAAESERINENLLRTPMLAYTKAVGLYAGATVKAGHISRNDKANFALYNTRYTMPELLYSDWVTPPAEVQPIMALVQSLAP